MEYYVKLVVIYISNLSCMINMEFIISCIYIFIDYVFNTIKTSLTITILSFIALFILNASKNLKKIKYSKI